MTITQIDELAEFNLSDVERDAVVLCQELIRIPSFNYGDGKGDERAAAEFVVSELLEVGIASKIYESAPGRCNVVANIPGVDQTRPGLVMHGHLDVVPAHKEDWSVDPCSGVIQSGMIWGRGALDMKNMDAMMLAIVRKWARVGYKPPRNIVLVLFADEEAGMTFGSRWMAKHHPEVFANCNEAISEVGGFSVTLSNGKRVYPVQSAEKGIHWMRLIAHGRPGHGSLINNANAVTALSEAVAKIGRHAWPIRYTETVKKFFKNLAEITDQPYDEKDLSPLIKEMGSTGLMVGATLQNTANPSMLSAGYKENVIPQSASAVIDGRFLPGYEEEFNATIRQLIGPDIEIQTISRDIALEAGFESPLCKAMSAALISEDPDAIPLPYMISGGTDNKALSELGIAGYGFSPLLLPADLDFWPLFHGVDERVPVAGLAFGVRVLENLLENC